MFYVENRLVALKHRKFKDQGELHIRSIKEQKNLQFAINEWGDSVATLDSLIIVGHSSSLELTLILILGINVGHIIYQPTPILLKLVWVTLMFQ